MFNFSFREFNKTSGSKTPFSFSSSEPVKNESDMVRFRGTVEKLIWCSEKDFDIKNQKFGFVVKTKALQKVPTSFGMDWMDEFTVFAYLNECIEGAYLEISGYWSPLKEGRDTASFNAKHCLYVDDDAEGAKFMLKFCFGEKRAANIIWDAYDGDALEAWTCFKEDFEGFSHSVKRVKGVGRKSLENARTKYEDHMAVEVLQTRFKKYGLTFAEALKIFERWGGSSLSKIESNPYCLAKICPWKTVDTIALKGYSISLNDSRRVDACVLASLYSQESRGGHTYMRLNEPAFGIPTLEDEVSKVLGIDKSYIVDRVNQLEKEQKIVMDVHENHHVVYLPKFYKAETHLAKLLRGMVRANRNSVEDIDKYIEQYQKDKAEELHIEAFELADLQKQAIRTACMNQFSIISGPPGSGKTTIIDCVVKTLKELNPGLEIALCAPTGKAAKRMTESTGMPASTVHRLLKYDPSINDFKYNEENPLDADVVIADECSMMGIVLCDKLLSAVKDNATVIFVGDKDQLPSVDAGRVLADMLSVQDIPKVILNEVYRQKKGSTILERSLTLSGAKGEAKVPSLDDSEDFQFFNVSYCYNQMRQCTEQGYKEIVDGAVGLYLDQVGKYGIENVLFLIPRSKRTKNGNGLGCAEFNPLLQEKINPQSPDKREVALGRQKQRIFREGDRVIQTVNEDEFHVYNGMIGTITRIYKEEDTERDTIEVDFGDDIIVSYQHDRYDNIMLAYAMTIHKCQGSEAKSVIMLTVPQHKYQLSKKLVYTGFTRAKEILNVIGTPDMISHAATSKEPPRLSLLAWRLKKI